MPFISTFVCFVEIPVQYFNKNKPQELQKVSKQQHERLRQCKDAYKLRCFNMNMSLFCLHDLFKIGKHLLVIFALSPAFIFCKYMQQILFCLEFGKNVTSSEITTITITILLSILTHTVPTWYTYMVSLDILKIVWHVVSRLNSQLWSKVSNHGKLGLCFTF